MPKLKPETISARKSHILQAALARFASTGFDKTTMDDIVLEAGLSKGSIYTYFESKKALFLALLEQMLSDTGLIPILSAGTLSGHEKLEFALAGMVALTGTHTYQQYTNLLMDAWVQSQTDGEVRQTLASIYAGLRGLFARVIEQCIAAGDFKPTDATLVANLFIALFDGLMVQHAVDNAAVDWPITAATIHRSWMNGLLKTEE